MNWSGYPWPCNNSIPSVRPWSRCPRKPRACTELRNAGGLWHAPACSDSFRFKGVSNVSIVLAMQITLCTPVGLNKINHTYVHYVADESTCASVQSTRRNQTRYARALACPWRTSASTQTTRVRNYVYIYVVGWCTVLENKNKKVHIYMHVYIVRK